MSLDRSALYAAKLRALVRRRWSELEDGEPAPFPDGAALRIGARGFVLAELEPERALGGALAWALRRKVTELHVLVTGAAGALARRASGFATPPTIWLVSGTDLAEAVPDPVAAEAAVPQAAMAFEEMLRSAGAVPVHDGGVLAGEVLGLEVARVVVDGATARLEAGVGKHDREANKLAHGDQPAVEALARAVRVVREHRVPGSTHELATLSSERWLREVVVAHPDLVGARSLELVASPTARDDLRIAAPAAAAGLDVAGRPVLVVCSTGIDVDLVPAAADARLCDRRDPRLVLALPASDVHPVTRALAAALAEPAEIVEVGNDWRSLPVA